MNDEYIAKYYLGSGLEDIDRAMERIDERINSISSAAAFKKMTVGEIKKANMQKKEGRPSLEDLHRGIK